MIPLGLSAGMSAADAAIQKNIYIYMNYSVNNFKWKNGRYNENSWIAQGMKITNISNYWKN